MSDIYLSVVICTHNPRPDYLDEVQSALRKQSLPFGQWELMIVDNRSDIPVQELLDLSWHTHACVVREEILGLTPARLRGINETAGDILVFVDDDNVLGENYLEHAWIISKDWPILGAWGGRSIGRFETPPPEWFETKHYEMLAVRDVERDVWSNLVYNWETTPAGSGLVIRREVALKYAKAALTDPIRRTLDRKGNSLVSGGDNDMVNFACDMGLGMGRFRSLSLEHLIPKERTTLEYMVRLTEGIELSNVLLFALRDLMPEVDSPLSLIQRIRDRRYLKWLPHERRELVLAERRGRAKGIQKLKEFGIL
jgi:glycosyltransferase involved in cell wall biosynthesis